MPNVASKILLIIVTIMSSLSDKPIMNIKIDKININEMIYAKHSINNNIDKHVIIHEESGVPGNNIPIIIGAHSGIGPLAYFKNLNKLEINDEIKLNYKEKEYTYFVINKYKDDKNGMIKVSGDNDLILFTCYPNNSNYYLIIVSSLQV